MCFWCNRYPLWGESICDRWNRLDMSHKLYKQIAIVKFAKSKQVPDIPVYVMICCSKSFRWSGISIPEKKHEYHNLEAHIAGHFRIPAVTSDLVQRPTVFLLTFLELSKIISWKYIMLEITFMLRISSWNFVRVPISITPWAAKYSVKILKKIIRFHPIWSLVYWFWWITTTMRPSSISSSSVSSSLWASCQIRKIAGAHAPGMPGTFSPSPQVSDPDMHHGTCVTHVPWCMPGSPTIGFLWNRRRGKTFPAFPAHAQPAILRIW